MDISGRNRMSESFQETAGEKRCPECGDNMKEIDRCSENVFLFVWYECSRNDCDGQWLQKMSH
jgi:predicted RNA-binding Zn-ribbon protein involved in translation (DUF1610 family)